ncbi:hypothetical protein KIH41_02195 [Litoribacter ruber]|uniref:hypothetical protein n=1 Tax=Litoribacter ruber TaxID=702568 RepID=UPI001BD99EF1|nr:hypothetical protein [Litoribacter ruber]MBT0810090.1 hypothetical protein [Litoribacter ruber]
MKKKPKKRKKSPLNEGMETSFSIMGEGLSQRKSDNLESSWFNVGIYFKRAMNNVSVNRGLGSRFSEDELETY